MQLVHNWHKLIHKAWSLRLAIISGLLSGVEVIIPFFVDTMPRGIFSALAVITAIASAVARVIAQPRMYKP